MLCTEITWPLKNVSDKLAKSEGSDAILVENTLVNGIWTLPKEPPEFSVLFDFQQVW